MAEGRSGPGGATNLQPGEVDSAGIPTAGLPWRGAVIPTAKTQVLLGRVEAGLHSGLQESGARAEGGCTFWVQPGDKGHLEGERSV